MDSGETQVRGTEETETREPGNTRGGGREESGENWEDTVGEVRGERAGEQAQLTWLRTRVSEPGERQTEKQGQTQQRQSTGKSKRC